MIHTTLFTLHRFIFAVLALIACVVAFLGCTDNWTSRRVFDLYVESLASGARSRPNDTRQARALIAIARGPTSTQAERHRAVAGAHALGTLGPAASSVLNEMVGLLESPYDGVSQQAAWSLLELGPVTAPIVDGIASRIERGPLDTTAWIAVKALASCGAAAEKHIALLRELQGREPAMFSLTVTRAIADIEDASRDSVRRTPAGNP